MFSHIMVGCTDINRSSTFYDALLAPLGIKRRKENGKKLPYACWVDPSKLNTKFFVSLPFNNATATAGNGTMVAFMAGSTAGVDTAYKAGISLGGSDEGTPGPRPQYGENYYGAYLLDPDGNKIHLVHHSTKEATAP